MRAYEEYTTKAGETISINLDLSRNVWEVLNCKGDEVRWHLEFKDADKAKAEFERWRNY